MFRLKRNKIELKKYWFLLAVVFLGLILFTFNDLGLLKWYSLNRDKARLQAEIDQLLKREAELTAEIDKLKNDDTYLEKIAREHFQMVKPGEKVFRVRDLRHVKD